LSAFRIQKIVEAIDAIHRELARASISQLLGRPSAIGTEEILDAHPLPLQRDTWGLLREAIVAAEDPSEAQRIERILFGCADLAVEQATASLRDMLNFYFQRGRMLVGSEKIPAPEVVPWLQTQDDFGKREEMQKENNIFLKGIMNPMLTAILELTVRVVREQFGFKNYARFSEAKKGVSFEEKAALFEKYLVDTEQTYHARMTPWVEEKIGRPFENLSRYHALYLMRIRGFDTYFPPSDLLPLVQETFRGLGFDLPARADVIMDITDHPAKSPDGMCVGVEIPGEVHVLMKPVGGVIDVETLLHETGHAFFLSHFNPRLPIEFRRLYRSASLDEAFAFLFMDLIGSRAWLTGVAGLPPGQADKLAESFRTKRLCLIRRFMGKFLAEKEFHEKGDLKNSEGYCRHLNHATGFVYEPQGYLIDMEPDLYSLDYVTAWAGANALRDCLEERFGEEWFRETRAGDFLKEIASSGRSYQLDEVLVPFCGRPATLHTFDGH